jgi:hypothetical protein
VNETQRSRLERIESVTCTDVHNCMRVRNKKCTGCACIASAFSILCLCLSSAFPTLLSAPPPSRQLVRSLSRTRSSLRSFNCTMTRRGSSPRFNPGHIYFLCFRLRLSSCTRERMCASPRPLALASVRARITTLLVTHVLGLALAVARHAHVRDITRYRVRA